MLSKQAFNALLKTLEEPPPHVKFIFATTEIRKVPVTVLSRCQRFDLRRVDQETLIDHFRSICEKEGVSSEDEALALIARAADGSVRDGLSLLDRAIALGDETVSGAQVRDMLGLSDRARTMDLLEHVLQGHMPEALEIMDSLYAVGADPSILIQDLLDLVHALTKFRAVPEAASIKQAMGEEDIARAQEIAGKVSMPSLGKAWQILLKGLGEVNMAANPQSAAEMVIIRLSYAADLPDPRDLIKKLEREEGNTGASAGPSQSQSSSSAPQREPTPVALKAVSSSGGGGGSQAAQARAQLNPAPDEEAQLETALVSYPIETIEDVVAFLEAADEIRLAGLVYSSVHLVRIENKVETGRLEVRVREEAPQNLTQELTKVMSAHHGKRWIVSVSDAAGAPTLSEKAKVLHEEKLAEVKEAPLVKEVLTHFPDAEIVDINAQLEK